MSDASGSSPPTPSGDRGPGAARRGALRRVLPGLLAAVVLLAGASGAIAGGGPPAIGPEGPHEPGPIGIRALDPAPARASVPIGNGAGRTGRPPVLPIPPRRPAWPRALPAVHGTAAVPSPPVGLEATAQNATTVELLWSPPASAGSPATSLLYTIYLEEVNESPFQPVGATLNLTWTATGLRPGPSYRAEVTASNGAGPGAPSAPVEFSLNSSGGPSATGDLGVLVALVALVLLLGVGASVLALAFSPPRKAPPSVAGPSPAAIPAFSPDPRGEPRPPLPRSSRPHRPTDPQREPWDEL